ncbi:DUF488 family protein [Reyranella sp.]|uniref:DUF488 family protein n=1 Tax=Reyranella sp. TaxID=1929291 RepID=UPI0037846B3A
MRRIKTIGHSNHPIEHFLGLLEGGGVEAVVDVRSVPYSRRFPQFGRERLAQSLASRGILYRYEGGALGGKPRSGEDYEALAAAPEFAEALSRLIAGAANTTLCLMCAEKDPLDCHRTVLVSRRLAERGVAIDHLLADGKQTSHDAIEDALLGHSGDGVPDLFTSSQERAVRLARAYTHREQAMKRGQSRRK